jgi:predicted ester cyclase
MGKEENRSVARRYFTDLLSNPSDLSFIEAFMQPHLTFYGPITPSGLHGAEHYRSFVQSWEKGFPDRRFSPGESVAEGDLVACRFTIEATHQGEFMDVQPTGNAIVIHGVNMFRFLDDKIEEITAFFNPHELLGPLGLDTAVEIPHPGR